MKSIEERLALSDPIGTTPYVPVDFDAMMGRVVASSRASASTWRYFKMRMAGAVATASVVTALGIAALNTVGSALPVLSFAAAAPHATSGAMKTVSPLPSGTFMRLNLNYQFTGADGLSTQAGRGVAYTLKAPIDPSATLSAAAGVLGVDIGAPTSADNGQSFSASGPVYTGWLVQNSGYATWGVNGTTSQSATTPPTYSVQHFESVALAYARQLGGFDLGAATLDPIVNAAPNPTVVMVPIEVNGQPTGFSYNFAFAGDGTLMSASGVSFSLAPGTDYPLVSPSAGVSEITSQLGVTSGPVNMPYGVGYVPSGVSAGSSGSAGAASTNSTGPSVTAPPSTGPTGSSGATPPSITSPTTSPTIASPPVVSPGTGTVVAPPTPTPTPTPPPINTVPTTTPTTLPVTPVDITGVSTRYGVYSMFNGSTMLLPVYVYTGTVVGDTKHSVTFQVVAIDPSYLDLAVVSNTTN